MVHKLRPALAPLLILVAALAVSRPWDASDPARTAAACHRAGQDDRPEARPAADPMYAGPRGAESACGEHPGHPGSFVDLAQASGARAARAVAPGTQLKPGAYRAAVAQRAALPSAAGTWTPYGKTPLIADRTEYDARSA